MIEATALRVVSSRPSRHDVHRLLDRPHRHADVEADLLADLQHDARASLGAEPGQFGGDLVLAGREVRKVVAPELIGHAELHRVRGDVPGGDRHTRHHGASVVCHDTQIFTVVTCATTGRTPAANDSTAHRTASCFLMNSLPLTRASYCRNPRCDRYPTIRRLRSDAPWERVEHGTTASSAPKTGISVTPTDRAPS